MSKQGPEGTKQVTFLSDHKFTKLRTAVTSITSADENKTATKNKAGTTNDTATTSTTETVIETTKRTIDEVVSVDGGKESHIRRVITETVEITRNKKSVASESLKSSEQEQLSEQEHKQEKDSAQVVKT
jgi:hypothetical protein